MASDMRNKGVKRCAFCVKGDVMALKGENHRSEKLFVLILAILMVLGTMPFAPFLWSLDESIKKRTYYSSRDDGTHSEISMA